MLLSIGMNVSVSIEKVIAVIGWSETEGKQSKINHIFLNYINKKGEVIDASGEQTKSLIIADNDKVYLSAISKKTMEKRCRRRGF